MCLFSFSTRPLVLIELFDFFVWWLMFRLDTVQHTVWWCSWWRWWNRVVTLVPNQISSISLLLSSKLIQSVSQLIKSSTSLGAREHTPRSDDFKTGQVNNAKIIISFSFSFVCVSMYVNVCSVFIIITQLYITSAVCVSWRPTQTDRSKSEITCWKYKHSLTWQDTDLGHRVWLWKLKMWKS